MATMPTQLNALTLEHTYHSLHEFANIAMTGFLSSKRSPSD